MAKCLSLTMSSDEDKFSDGGPTKLSTKYVITDALKVSSPSLNGDIDPEYQRGPFFLILFHSHHKYIVWPEAKQVNSIFTSLLSFVT